MTGGCDEPERPRGRENGWRYAVACVRTRKAERVRPIPALHDQGRTRLAQLEPFLAIADLESSFFGCAISRQRILRSSRYATIKTFRTSYG